MIFRKKDKNKNAPNRRRHPRVKSLNLIRWSLTNEGKAGEGWVENIRDLSESGIRFCSDQEVPAKGMVDLVLSLTKEGKEVHILGEITWVNQITAYGSTYSQVGILFTEVKDSDRAMIRQLIQQLQSP